MGLRAGDVFAGGTPHLVPQDQKGSLPEVCSRSGTQAEVDLLLQEQRKYQQLVTCVMLNKPIPQTKEQIKHHFGAYLEC